MRYLLCMVLALFPVSGRAADSMPLSANEVDQKTAERFITEKPSGDPVDQSWPYANPYQPTSPTNFDVFISPLSPLPDGNDRSRLSLYLSDSGPSPFVYGHFGSPFFSDSINRRNETSHPYALDSPTNQYGRSWFSEKR